MATIKQNEEANSYFVGMNFLFVDTICIYFSPHDIYGGPYFAVWFFLNTINPNWLLIVFLLQQYSIKSLWYNYYIYIYIYIYIMQHWLKLYHKHSHDAY